MLPLQKYEFNPLLSTPMIRFSLVGNMKQRIIAPSVADLVYASCEGVYFKVQDAFRGEGKVNEFSDAFGKLFECYVRNLLTLAGVHHLPEEENEKAIDAFVSGKRRNIHIECKKNVMSNDARICAGDAAERFIKRIAEDNILKQLYKKRDANSINLLICMDELYSFDDKVKPVIEQHLKKNKDYDPSFRFHILGITDLEIVSSVLHTKQLSIEDLFTAKEKDAYYEDAGGFAERWSGHMVMEPAFLREKYRQFTSSWK